MIETLPYVMTAALRQRLDLLHHVLEFGRQLVLVSGASGSGRTRLLGILCDEAPAHWRLLRHQGADLATPQRLLAALASGLGVLGQESEPLLRRVRSGLAGERTAGRSCVLIIDDAGPVDEGCLTLLYDLAAGADGSGDLRVVMAGDSASDLPERLTDLAPQPASLHLVEMPAFDSSAAEALIARMEDACGARLPVDTAQLEVLRQRVHGRPGALLAACLPLLDKTSAAPDRLAAPAGAPGAAGVATDRTRTAALPRKLLWVAALCAVGAVAGALLHYASAKRRQADGVVELTLPANPQSAAVDGGPPTPPPPSFAPARPVAEATPEAPVQAVPHPAGASDAEPSAYATVAADTGQVDDSAASGFGVTTTTRIPADPATAAASTGSTSPAPAASDREAVVPAAPSAGARAAEPAARKAVTPATAPQAAPGGGARAALAGEGKDAQMAPERDGPPDRKPYSSEWVLTQAAGSYVIQLFATREREAATRFIARHGLGGRAAVAPITHAGARWYVVIHGHYPDRAAANTALARLPAPLAALKPWPRLVQSLQGVSASP